MTSSSALSTWDDVLTYEAARLVSDLVRDPGDYDYLFERYSTTLMMQMLYGQNISGHPEEKDHVNTIMTITHNLERTVAPGAYLVDFIHALKYLPEFLAPFKREGRLLHKYEYSYFHSLVADARERHDPEYGRTARGLVDTYFENTNFWDLTEFEISYCLGTLFEGGSGTTFSTMQSYCLAMLHFPEWQTKVQKEIDEVVGSERPPSFEDWPGLPVVRAAMKETLRWRPVVPGGLWPTPFLSTTNTSADPFIRNTSPPR